MNSDWLFQRTKLDPAYGGMDRGYNQTSHTAGMRTADDIVRDRGSGMGVTAVNRASNGNGGSKFIGSPSGTDWARTFGRNGGLGVSTDVSSPSKTDWNKTFGGGSSFGGQKTENTGQSGFSFNISPASDRSQLSVGTDTTNFYKERVANMDLTKKDHELYGAGSDYGFNY